LDETSINLFPNPAAEDVNLNRALVKPAVVSYTVVNALGQKVITNELGKLPAGSTSFIIRTSNLSTGVYLVQVSTNEEVYTYRVVLK
jgi:hypothetical protein